ncbi:MAG: hypothetical protein EAZ08_01360 [Cytophagales bacterium]|nr:MAG: hypothetical protein EAZ08_01360 [Cytophagales bacterium]
MFGQENINNELSDKHTEVKGTKISIILPNGFSKATTFLGFQNEKKGATINVMEMPAPFSEISKGFSKEALAQKGVEVQEIKKMIINNTSAVLITGEQKAYGNIYSKYVLVLGHDKESVIINCAFLKQFNEMSNAIKVV